MEMLADAFRVLGDQTRLRLVRLLATARLNVSELVSLVGIGQSSVSHHLARLKALGMLREERQGGFTYCELDVSPQSPLAPVIKLAQEAADQHGDLARLTELLRRRDDATTQSERLLEPGQSWRLWARALGSLLPPMAVVDLGCGSGLLALEIAHWASSVQAVDVNRPALEKGRQEAERRNLTNVTFIEGDIRALPLAANSADLAVISQSLHCIEDIDGVLSEARRVLRDNGRVLVLELLPHEESWVRSRIGHEHLGFTPSSLSRRLAHAGFGRPKSLVAPRSVESPFQPYCLLATKQPTSRRTRSAA